MLGQGLDAARDYLEVCKVAGLPQAGSWVLGTLGGIMAGRYGLGPYLADVADVAIPDEVADHAMRESAAKVTGSFMGAGLGGSLGYALSGQRKLDLSPSGILRSTAAMTPEGAYEHPPEVPTYRDFATQRNKTASAWPLAGWLAPTLGGIAAGGYLGSQAAPFIHELMPDGSPVEAAGELGAIGGGVLGAEAGSIAGRALATKIRDRETLGAGLNAPGSDKIAAEGFLPALGTFGKWLVPMAGGVLAGHIVGDAAAPLIHPFYGDNIDESAELGRIVAGHFGGMAGAMAGYGLTRRAEAPDMSPVGVTTIAAGVPVHPEDVAVNPLVGEASKVVDPTAPLPPGQAAKTAEEDADYIVSPNEHAAMQAFRDKGEQWNAGTDPRRALHEYAQLGSAGTRIRIGPVGVRHFSRAFSMLPGNESWNPSFDRHYDEFQRGPLSGHLLRLQEYDEGFQKDKDPKWQHQGGEHQNLKNILSAVDKHGINADPSQLLEASRPYLPKEWTAHPGAEATYANGYRQMLDDIKPHLTDGNKVEIKPDFSGRLRREAELFSAKTFGKSIAGLSPQEQEVLHNNFNDYLKSNAPRVYTEKQIADFFVGLDVPRAGKVYSLVAKPMNAVGDLFGRTPAATVEQKPMKSLIPNASAFLSPEGAAIGAGVAGLGIGGTLLAHTLLGGDGHAAVAQPQVA